MKGDNSESQVYTVTDTPPLIREKGGQFYLRVISGDRVIDAPIGEWFIMQFMEKVVMQRLHHNAVIEGGKED
jgi:hypothetical protein